MYVDEDMFECLEDGDLVIKMLWLGAVVSYGHKSMNGRIIGMDLAYWIR